MKLPVELLESLMTDLTLLAATAKELFPKDFEAGCDNYVKRTVGRLLAEWAERKGEDWEVI